jgi:acyl-ACP thioesterase
MTVGGADVDPAELAHLSTLARWLQDVAVADALDAGVEARSAWIIRRVTIEVAALPRFAERLEVRTWCSGMAKSIAERTTTIEGDLGASVRSVAIWVHMDPETRRPARLPEIFQSGFAESAAGARPRSALRHPPSPPDDAEALDWGFTRADLDIAGHVNNTMYWRVAEDLLPAPAGAAIAEAEYRAGIGPGRAVVHRSGSGLWIGDPAGEVAATLSVRPGGEGS